MTPRQVLPVIGVVLFVWLMYVGWPHSGFALGVTLAFVAMTGTVLVVCAAIAVNHWDFWNY